jgi:hypothetical protein
MLSSWGVRLAFTGHCRAQNIARAGFKDGTVLYDVQTGSLSRALHPIRYVTISDNRAIIDTVTLSEEPIMSLDPIIIQEAYDFLKRRRLSDDDAHYIAVFAAEAFEAHFQGDEDASRRSPVVTGNLSLWGRLVYRRYAYVLDGLWSGPPPGDNAAILNLG